VTTRVPQVVAESEWLRGKENPNNPFHSANAQKIADTIGCMARVCGSDSVKTIYGDPHHTILTGSRTANLAPRSLVTPMPVGSENVEERQFLKAVEGTFRQYRTKLLYVECNMASRVYEGVVGFPLNKQKQDRQSVLVVRTDRWC